MNYQLTERIKIQNAISYPNTLLLEKPLTPLLVLHRAFPRASTSQKVSVLKNCIVEFKTMYYTYKVLQNKD